MKITIESTATLTRINGVPCRHWRGITEAGVPCDVFVLQIAVRSDQDAAAFVTDARRVPCQKRCSSPSRRSSHENPPDRGPSSARPARR